jgi:hypothetical protein
MIKPIANRKKESMAMRISFSKIAINPKMMKPKPTFATGTHD